MRVLFVSPPMLPAGAVSPPLALVTLVSAVLKICSEIRVLDYDLLFFKKENRDRSFLRKRFEQELSDAKPDVVLFTSMYNNSVIATELIRLTKILLKSAVTVAGGPHFGAQPALALERISELDYVIEGEGEIALPALLRAILGVEDLSEVPNLARRLDGKIVKSHRTGLADLSTLANVWEATAGIFKFSDYAQTISNKSDHRAIYIEAGRGCPFSCNFCAPAQFWDRKYRVKTPRQICSEITYLFESFAYDAFILVHDLLTVDARFVDELSNQISDLSLPIQWMGNSRTDLKNARQFSKLAASGCWRLFYGVDSGSRRVQREMGKHLDPDESFNVVRDCCRNGISAVCSFVIGHQSEGIEDLESSLSLACRLKLVGAENVQFHRLRLFPPAPIAVGDQLQARLLDATLDRTTLRLEFPYSDVSPDELNEINGNKTFYSGYFPPSSAAATAEELSQIELFFTQAIAFAPLTIYALVSLGFSRGLVSTFLENLKLHGFIDRFAFNPCEIDVVQNWAVVKTRLSQIIATHGECSSGAESIGSRIATALLDYEDARMRFTHSLPPNPIAVVWLTEQALLRSAVAVDRVIDAVLSGQPVPEGVLASSLIEIRRGSSKLTIYPDAAA